MKTMLRSLCVLSTTLMLCGCGGSSDTPDLGRVSGTVTVDGKPADGVTVLFTPADGGRSSTGQTDSSGHYELVYSSSEMGAKVGSHAVSISPASAMPNDESDDLMNTGGSEIPQEYLEEKKQVEVKAGPNEIDLTYP
ncbi:carboxypeptidase-like regulatory domain-containing protein [Rubinisphaera margarita]|uniref:carboxypeptidase-like regulatory domain-containing protein n=1 Tax=Rubinisphaera margarita TaxID=2909586 RepID=UPI001EE9574E|nr:carboxypeptidase-like regulatory domain-containing protein [Rubinisphaera margarita]MCG6157783.1 carboxypeptidase-like regulatory domain-containing protein [Rubinisphaera margarita]